MDSIEFAEWLQYWELSAEMSSLAEHESTEEETVARLRGFAAAHNARLDVEKPSRTNAIAGESGPRRDDGTPRRGVS